VYIYDQLLRASSVRKAEEFERLFKLTQIATDNEIKVKSTEPVSLEEWDPRPVEQEFDHPIEQVLREYAGRSIRVSSRSRNKIQTSSNKQKP
jgi:hypothetical protein